MVDALVSDSHHLLRQGRKTTGSTEIAAIHSDHIFNDDH